MLRVGHAHSVFSSTMTAVVEKGMKTKFIERRLLNLDVISARKASQTRMPCNITWKVTGNKKLIVICVDSNPLPR